MKKHYQLFTALSLAGIIILALWGEQIDAFITGIVKFILFVPEPIGYFYCVLAMAFVITWCVVKSSKGHWPTETEFQNEDKQECNHD